MSRNGSVIFLYQDFVCGFGPVSFQMGNRKPWKVCKINVGIPNFRAPNELNVSYCFSPQN